LFGNDNINNEVHYVASKIPIFLNAKFVYRVDRCQNIKFNFAPKLPSICINQKCSMGVESLHIL